MTQRHDEVGPPWVACHPAGSGKRCADVPSSVRQLVELRGVSRSFGTGESTVHAVRSVDLSISAGEFCAVVGPSGSGKSTLLNMIGLLDTPSTGDFSLEGVDAGHLPERDRTRLRGRFIGFVFQAFHLITHKTVRDNIALSTAYAGIPRRLRQELVDDALDSVGLVHRRGAYPPTLSGGEQQRVAIARAVASAPMLLLCDEPTGNLDSTTAATIMTLLRRLNVERHLTVVLITHDDKIADQADRIITMRDGHIVADTRTRPTPVR